MSDDWRLSDAPRGLACVGAWCVGAWRSGVAPRPMASNPRLTARWRGLSCNGVATVEKRPP
eukprot:scaffold129268_cov42-Phaeocystis_antarctica.AAC.1